MTERKPLGLPEVADLLDQSHETRKAILVGGQALNVLAVYYKLEAAAAAVSEDIDFFGDAKTARDAGKAWGSQTRVATMDDITPNSAYVIIEIDGEKHQIDFMAQILGVKVDELRAWARTVEVDDKTFRVMHPLHVLQAQLENVYGALNRRITGDRTVSRTRLAVRVVRAALHEELETGDEHAALIAAERITEIAQLPTGLRAWHEDHVELLDAVPSHENWPTAFVTKRFPQIQAYIGGKRRKYSRQKLKTSKHAATR